MQDVLSESRQALNREQPILELNQDNESQISGANFDTITNPTISEASHGIANKLQNANAPFKAKLMHQSPNTHLWTNNEDEDDDDFFDALDQYQALTYQKSQ